ncbi:MAG TPA: site-specific integrase [Roseiflexaceae bacterium]|nr:site-specific integrase [Roseiflexaceae bacterium]
MARKRADGEGSPRKRQNGRWEWSVMLDGKRHWITGKTRTEAQERYEELKRRHKEGQDLGKSAQTMDAFLTQWLEEVAKPTLRPRTFEYYESVVRRYLKPALGSVRLRDLDHQQVQQMVHRLPKTLAPRTVRNIRAILRRALNTALTWRLVTYNAATGIAMPKVERYQAQVLTPEEANRLRKVLQGHPREAAYLLMMGLGLRRGEVLGLLKEEVNLAKRTIHITGQVQVIRGKVQRVATKTDASRRVLPIPEVLMEPLERALAMQPGSVLLFPTAKGTPILPRTLVQQFKGLLRKAELPATIRLHDLRHFAATMLLAGGADISTTQAVLGHTDASITLNFYAHAMPDRTRDVVNNVVNTVLGSRPKCEIPQ